MEIAETMVLTIVANSVGSSILHLEQVCVQRAHKGWLLAPKGTDSDMLFPVNGQSNVLTIVFSLLEDMANCSRGITLNTVFMSRKGIR